MYPYLGFLWDPSSAAAKQHVQRLSSPLTRRTTDWTLRLNAHGLMVFDAQPRRGALTAYLLVGGRGVVLGRLFSRGRSTAPAHANSFLDESTATQIAASGGSYLIDRYWGSYVAFIIEPHADVRHVIRDCSGMMPCYRTRVGDVDVLFSDVRDLALLEIDDFTINWDYVAAFMISSQMQIRESALNEVTELLAGERLTFRGSAIDQHFAWNPADACADPIHDYATAIRELRETTQECIDAWSSVQSSILHSLSGGFDSAVVLGCLTRAPLRPSIVCMNRYGDEPAEDERRYARLAAERAQVRLLEIPWHFPDRVFDERLLDLPCEVKPQLGPLVTHFDAGLLNGLA